MLHAWRHQRKPWRETISRCRMDRLGASPRNRAADVGHVPIAELVWSWRVKQRAVEIIVRLLSRFDWIKSSFVYQMFVWLFSLIFSSIFVWSHSHRCDRMFDARRSSAVRARIPTLRIDDLPRLKFAVFKEKSLFELDSIQPLIDSMSASLFDSQSLGATDTHRTPSSVMRSSGMSSSDERQSAIDLTRSDEHRQQPERTDSVSCWYVHSTLKS